MSETKEFKPLDVGASERVPWKIARGLSNNIAFTGDGSLEVGKNLEVDGGASFLGKEVKILNYYVNEGENNDIFQGYFLGYCEKIEDVFFLNGIFADSENDGMYAVYDGFKIDDAIMSITDDKIILSKNGEKALGGYTIPTGNLKTIFGNQSLVGEGNIDLYRHKIQVGTGAVGGAVVIDYYSSKNLICDSVQDLRTLLGNNTFYGIFNQAPFSGGILTITASTCKVQWGSGESYDVTFVSDTVTTI